MTRLHHIILYVKRAINPFYQQNNVYTRHEVLSSPCVVQPAVLPVKRVNSPFFFFTKGVSRFFCGRKTG